CRGFVSFPLCPNLLFPQLGHFYLPRRRGRAEIEQVIAVSLRLLVYHRIRGRGETMRDDRTTARGLRQPVKRRTRTFRPNYLSFAGTYQCNLTCPHCCVPIEWPDRLDIQVALR